MKRNITLLALCGFLLLGHIDVNAKTFDLPTLPYALDALAPKISKQTMELHYGKHLQTYVNNLNTLISGTPFASADLETIVKTAEGAVFNNAAQLWNHTLYFHQFSPQPRTKPGGKLAAAIEKSFGSFEAFKEQFNKAAAGLFGSGWVWLVKNEDASLSITQESNAGNPLRRGQQALIGCDVWEHAYYLDYQNRRGEYINAFWELLDWSVIEKRL
jgi:Fe-Mn family superoxide dismutase